jgi:hypothetical protein
VKRGDRREGGGDLRSAGAGSGDPRTAEWYSSRSARGFPPRGARRLHCDVAVVVERAGFAEGGEGFEDFFDAVDSGGKACEKGVVRDRNCRYPGMKVGPIICKGRERSLRL